MLADTPKLIVELLANFEELDSFSCGEKQMDDFIHGNLKDCSINHYCTTYCVRDKDNNDIAAIFSLSFDSVDIDHDDFDDMRIGAAGTDKPYVTESFRDRFEEKYTWHCTKIVIVLFLFMKNVILPSKLLFLRLMFGLCIKLCG